MYLNLIAPTYLSERSDSKMRVRLSCSRQKLSAACSEIVGNLKHFLCAFQAEHRGSVPVLFVSGQFNSGSGDRSSPFSWEVPHLKTLVGVKAVWRSNFRDTQRPDGA